MTATHSSTFEDPIFAMIRAAGISGFKHDVAHSAETLDTGAVSAASLHKTPDYAATVKALRGRPDDPEPVLALVRAVGLPGFESSETNARVHPW